MFSFAEICDADGTLIGEATIRELSRNGANLRLKSVIDLPEKLIIRSRPGRNAYPARLIWMSGVSIGVEFDKALPSRRDR